MSDPHHSAVPAIELLRIEHQIIEAVLASLESEASGLSSGAELTDRFWRDAIEFLRIFAERSHYQKEEQCLFPALLAAGITDRGGPVGTLRAEHEASRLAVARIDRARAAGDVATLIHATRECVALLRDHISKEEKVLYVLAERVLSQHAANLVLAAMEHHERSRDLNETAHLLQLAAELCAHTGTPSAPIDRAVSSANQERGRASGPHGSETKETER